MTYIEALDKLPFPYNEMAKEYYLKRPYEYADMVDSAGEALSTGFLWGGTQQGKDFWRAIYDNCQHENL